MLIYFNPNITRPVDHISAIGHTAKDYPDTLVVSCNCICCYDETQYHLSDSDSTSSRIFVFSPQDSDDPVPLAHLIAQTYEHRKACHPKSQEVSRHIVKHINAQLSAYAHAKYILLLVDTEYNIIHVVASPTQNLYHGLTTTTAQAVSPKQTDMPRDVIYVLRNEPARYFLTWYESGISQTTQSSGQASIPRECHLCRV